MQHSVCRGGRDGRAQFYSHHVQVMGNRLGKNYACWLQHWRTQSHSSCCVQWISKMQCERRQFPHYEKPAFPERWMTSTKTVFTLLSSHWLHNLLSASGWKAQNMQSKGPQIKCTKEGGPLENAQWLMQIGVLVVTSGKNVRLFSILWENYDERRDVTYIPWIIAPSPTTLHPVLSEEWAI